ncbi:hypothetical protein TDIS_0654 [Thermosulfurimonas dismutans]|uniref:Uncharacterized protein n=1 Tax=Thermosulfurimonas dismutans TaxID=999894 RepID=A0A179D639_9BACT|nr:hypothetical protein TDIS_0654 [Thermosulfurimonas dismutans]
MPIVGSAILHLLNQNFDVKKESHPILFIPLWLSPPFPFYFLHYPLRRI